MYKYYFKTPLSVLLDVYPEVELLNHMAILCLIFFFSHNCHTVFHSSYTILRSHQWYTGSNFSISVFIFVACAFGVTFKKSLPNIMSWSFSPIFSSESFIVLGFTLRSLIQFTDECFLKFCLDLEFALLLIDYFMH